MKLIDKIQQTNSGKPTDYSKIYTPTAELIEKITDNFAIEFAEWIFKLGVYEYLNDFKNKTTKELLEEFKKEKGL
jgi:hypothetical protein